MGKEGRLCGGKAWQGARRIYSQTQWSLPQRVKAAQPLSAELSGNQILRAEQGSRGMFFFSVCLLAVAGS